MGECKNNIGREGGHAKYRKDDMCFVFKGRNFLDCPAWTVWKQLYQ